MDKKSVPLTFALLGNGVLRHVDDVDNGLACDCFCPTCGSSLVAKHGSQTIHHFAHEGSSDCIGGVETALHLAAKEILTKERQMMLPPPRRICQSQRLFRQAAPSKTIYCF